jgi:hypothetical protein
MRPDARLSSRPNRCYLPIHMLILDRITTLYSAEEDRLSISATIKDGGTARIWLTQRITNRLIPPLLKLVGPKKDDPLYSEVIAEIAQQKAVERQEVVAPVRVQEVQHEWLVHKIDLSLASSGAALKLWNLDGQGADVNLHGELLRQWLDIVRRLYIKAGWTGVDWPDWMKAAETPRKKSQILH